MAKAKRGRAFTTGAVKPVDERRPTFAARVELARYIEEANLGRNRRISSTAFLPNEGEQFLSVNSLEIEELSVIVDYYRSKFQFGNGKVAVSCLQIMVYNRACESGGVAVTYNRNRGHWTFLKDGVPSDAYRLHSNYSKSHCGVEPICLMDEVAAGKFARRLAGQPPGRNPHWL